MSSKSKCSRVYWGLKGFVKMAVRGDVIKKSKGTYCKLMKIVDMSMFLSVWLSAYLSICLTTTSREDFIPSSLTMYNVSQDSFFNAVIAFLLVNNLHAEGLSLLQREAAHSDKIHKRQFERQLLNSQNKFTSSLLTEWVFSCIKLTSQSSLCELHLSQQLYTLSHCRCFLWGSKIKRTLFVLF